MKGCTAYVVQKWSIWFCKKFYRVKVRLVFWRIRSTDKGIIFKFIGADPVFQNGCLSGSFLKDIYIYIYNPITTKITMKNFHDIIKQIFYNDNRELLFNCPRQTKMVFYFKPFWIGWL